MAAAHPGTLTSPVHALGGCTRARGSLYIKAEGRSGGARARGEGAGRRLMVRFGARASWMDTRSWSFILSNSSMRQMPRSASTSAPPSSVHSRVTGSFCTAAVRPTALAPLPAPRRAGRPLGRNQGAPCPNPACCARPAPARWRSGSPLEAPPACRRAAAGKARVAPSASPRALCWNAGDAVSRALHVLPACRPGQTEPNRAQRCTRRRATSLRARRTCAKILTYHTLHRAQRRRFYMTPRARCTGGLHGALGHLLHVIEELALGDALP